MTKSTKREWIIQRCIVAADNHYEDWPGYCERLLTRAEMITALTECEAKWPEHEFRGHNVVNQKPGSDYLRFHPHLHRQHDVEPQKRDDFLLTIPSEAEPHDLTV